MGKPQRFVVFGMYQYYPSGGWKDFVGSKATLEEALKFAGEMCSYAYENEDGYEYLHIVDLESGEIVARVPEYKKKGVKI